MNTNAAISSRPRSQQEIRSLLAAYRSSQQTQKEFSRIHGVGLSTLGTYLRRERKQQAPISALTPATESPRLVAVDVSRTPTPTTTPLAKVAGAEACACRGSLMVYLTHPRRTAVGRGFDAETLWRLVTALEGM